MGYDYNKQRSELFNDDGQRLFLRIRDNVQRLLKLSGAVRMQEAWSGCGGGSSWTMLAAVDRMVELGELHELTDVETPGQYRVFISGQNEQ